MTEAEIEWIVQSGGFQAVHVCRVVFLALAAGVALCQGARLALLAAFRSRLAGTPRHLPRPAAGVALAGALLLAAATLAYAAVRPDEYYHASLGRGALERGDPATAVRHLRPLADWGTDRPDVHEALGRALARLGRPREAVEALHAAQERRASPSYEPELLCAMLHERLGEVPEALRHLDRILPLAPPQDREALARWRRALAEGRAAPPPGPSP